MSKQDCLIIFTRKPEKGKVKTRLAKGVGEDKALEVYKYLLKHSAKTSAEVEGIKQVWYTNTIEKNDIWDDHVFEKLVQIEGDLGSKMKSAFNYNFSKGFQKVVIIGTDLLDIDSQIIKQAFQHLDQKDVVFGPAKDGGYYLLGMRDFIPQLFEGIDWSTERVLEQSINKIPNRSYGLLEVKNDIDFKEDALQHHELKEIIDL